MIVNIDVIGTVGEGKTAICFMLKEFFEKLTENFEINVEGEREFIWKDWEMYRERFLVMFKEKELKVNIKTFQMNRKSNEN